MEKENSSDHHSASSEKTDPSSILDQAAQKKSAQAKANGRVGEQHLSPQPPNQRLLMPRTPEERLVYLREEPDVTELEEAKAEKVPEEGYTQITIKLKNSYANALLQKFEKQRPDIANGEPIGAGIPWKNRFFGNAIEVLTDTAIELKERLGFAEEKETEYKHEVDRLERKIQHQDHQRFWIGLVAGIFIAALISVVLWSLTKKQSR